MIYYITESGFKSHLDKNFHKKNNDTEFDFISIHSSDSKPYMHNTVYKKFGKNFLKYADGVIAINKENKEYAGYVFIHDGAWEEKDGYWYVGYMINPIEVNKKYRGYGLGDKLLNLAINKYKADLLEVNLDNEIALRMYKKAGFKKITDATGSDEAILMGRGNTWMKKKDVKGEDLK